MSCEAPLILQLAVLFVACARQRRCSRRARPSHVVGPPPSSGRRRMWDAREWGLEANWCGASTRSSTDLREVEKIWWAAEVAAKSG